jgi:hypothetical protein
MTIHDLNQFKNQHGRLIFKNKLGFDCTLFGYVREVNQDYYIWEDNELPDKFKIRNVKSFELMKLPEWENI